MRLWKSRRPERRQLSARRLRQIREYGRPMPLLLWSSRRFPVAKEDKGD